MDMPKIQPSSPDQWAEYYNNKYREADKQLSYVAHMLTHVARLSLEGGASNQHDLYVLFQRVANCLKYPRDKDPLLAELKNHKQYAGSILRQAFVGEFRANRQRMILQWCQDTFGSDSITTAERGSRFMEEAVELVQAVGLTKEQVLRIVDYVFTKPPGEVFQEVGGVGLTLEALAESFALGVEEDTVREWERAQALTKKQLQKRHAVKVKGGIAK